MRRKNAEGVTWQGKHYTGYEATQKQRQIERSIRAQKNRILVAEAAGDAKALQTAQIRLRQLQLQYDAFSKGVGLRTQEERLWVSGFDSGSAKGYNNRVDAEQHTRYRSVLKNKVPQDLEAFQKIKHDDAAAWERLKRQYRIVNQYKVDSGSFTVDEILELDRQLITEKREHFSSKYKRKGNVAGAYADNEFYLAHSKINATKDASAYKGLHRLALLRENRIFNYIPVKTTGGTLRTDAYIDTEAKLFEQFAAMYSTKPFKEITMISERGLCESCKGVMEQFKQQFPEVSVRVISNKKAIGDVWKYRGRSKR